MRKMSAQTSNASVAVFSPWTLDLSRPLPRTAKDQGRRSKDEHLLLLILARPICLQTIAFGDLRFELVVAHVVVGEPVSRHVVGGAVAEANPVARIRIVPIPCGVVVPADHVDDRARWQQ